MTELVPFEGLATLASTRKPKAVAAWCARHRVRYFLDTKGRPCTTLSALDRALSRGESDNQPNFEPRYICASVEHWNLMPVLFDTVLHRASNSAAGGT